jgi:hypothetical protein
VAGQKSEKGVKVKPWKMEEFEQRQEKRERKMKNETQTEIGWK